MPDFSRAEIKRLLDVIDGAPTNDAKGLALEALGKHLFEMFDGVECAAQNVLEGPRAQELDLVFWNDRRASELHFLEAVIYVECKATASRVSSREVGWFVRKLQDHGTHFGILIALNGITGEGDNAAHSEVLSALLRDRITILILTRAEIVACANTSELARLLRDKTLKLTLERAVYLREEGL